MRNDLLINGVDMYESGVSMGKGFIDALEAFDAFKDDIENDSALEDGRRMVLSERLASREVTLTFVVWGAYGFRERLEAFRALLLTRKLTVKTGFSERRYRLIYTGRSATFSHGVHSCRIAAKFVEPDPTDRGEAPTNPLFGI